MNSRQKSFNRPMTLQIAVMALAVAAFVLGCSKKQGDAASEAQQKTFSTPEQASQALHAAAQAKDDHALTQVLGPKAKQLVSSGNATEDASATDMFARKYDQMNRLVAMTDGSQVLYIGADNYPFPIPLAKDASSKWYFDAAAGDEELRARKIGRNELYAMDTLRLIADAEKLYHQNTRRYTDIIVSAAGKQDGLHWEAIEGRPASPPSEISQGVFASSTPSNTLESHGYLFHVVTSPNDFTVFATPVNYQQSGIMTFSLSRDGVLYEQDLDAARASAAMSQYNPAIGWTQAE